MQNTQGLPLAMTASNLLQELETVPHHARILRMVELGRAAVHDPAITAMLAELAHGNFYQRFLALHACFGSDDSAHVLRTLTDPSRIIRGTALSLSVLVCDDTQLRQALQLVPRDGRLPLLWKLHHHGKQALIDEFLEHLAVIGDPQLRQLLPCGSPSLVRRFIGHFASTLSVAEWRRVARRHPVLANELLQTRAEAVPNLDIHLVSCVNSVLPILARKQPDQAIILVEKMARTTPLTRLDLDALLLRRPVAMVDLVLQASDFGELPFAHISQHLDVERLLALLTRYAGLRYSQGWFSTLTPETRLALYQFLATSWRNERGCLPPDLVALLPRAQREQEGRRHLALPALATRLEERLPYAAFLPWDEAYHLLEPCLRDPGEQRRSLAFQILTQTVRYERRHLPDLLALICTHLNEPDPVRGQMVDALAELPQSIWLREHLEALEQIVQYILNAFDTSPFTGGALLSLLLRVLECASEWSATHLALVAQKQDFAFSHYNWNFLTERDIRKIGPALRPVLLSWAERGDEQKLQPLISLMGKRVRVFDTLLDALEIVFSAGKTSFECGNEILSTIVKYRPARAAQIIPELIQNHRGWISYPAVLRYLHQHRQDLLTPFLRYRKYHRAFCQVQGSHFSYRRRTPRPLTSGFARWTSRQQTTFARMSLKVLHDEASDQLTLLLTIKQLAALPALPATYLTELANDPRPIVRDTALMQLAKLDNGEGITALQEALRDRRAVRALYALHPWIVSTSPTTALELLRALPFTRITLAKEVVRLLGELPGEEAYQTLLALDRQELHRDVRIAFLRALWFHLDRDETWQILEREGRSTDPHIALSAAHLSTSLSLARLDHTRKRFRRRAQQQPSTLAQIFRFSTWNTITLMHLSSEQLVWQAQERLMHLYALLLQHPNIEVRAAVLRGCTRLAAADHEQALLIQLLTALDTEQEDLCRTAASAIFGTCTASDAPSIGQAFERLLPNRAALRMALSAIKPELLLQRDQLLPVIREIGKVLASDPLTIGLRVELAIEFLPWDEVASLLMEAATTGRLHADALNRACQQLPQAVSRHYRRPARPDYHEMELLEEALAAHPDERLRRIAFAALTTLAASPSGWTAERRARLQVYRADPSPLVAAVAQFTVVPPAEAEIDKQGKQSDSQKRLGN